MKSRNEFNCRIFAFIFSILIMVFSQPVWSATFYIPDPCDPCVTIQTAIDNADSYDIIEVAAGIYSGDGYRDLDFHGKAITVISSDPCDPCATVIDCSDLLDGFHRGFYFHSGEESNAIVEGFTITNGRGVVGGGICCDKGSSPTIKNCVISNCAVTGIGGAIYCNDSSNPLIANCRIIANSAELCGGAIMCWQSSPTIKNTVICGNSAQDGGGLSCLNQSEVSVSNCTMFSNRARALDGWGGAVYCAYDDTSLNITNSILWGNTADEGNQIAIGSTGHTVTCAISYCDVLAGLGDIAIADPCNSSVSWGPGNIDKDPCFAQPGHWDDNLLPDPCDDFWVAGDNHLKSQAGRWDPTANAGLGGWVIDVVTSPCIDTGNPGSPLADEPCDVNNVRVNMGAYGGTSYASKTPPGWGKLADLNNDGFINLLDFAIMAADWLKSQDALPGDVNRNGTIDIADLEIMAGQWLINWQSPPAEQPPVM